MATPTTTSTAPPPPDMTLAKLNHDYCQLGCLGRGGFANVFLAQKQSGRQVALKVFRWGDDDDDGAASQPRQPNGAGGNSSSSDDEEEKSERDMKLATFERELDAVLQLDDSSSAANDSIIFFEDWFRGPDFACIVMKFADGGTLADEIVRKASAESVEPYTERRIGFYMLQLIQALSFAHQRGIAHMDVKSANILIHKGGKNGHQLVLTDWGSSCTLDGLWGLSTSSPIESMTELYASPEFQNAYNRRNFVGLNPVAIDSFALGCILYELMCCKKMVDLVEGYNETLGEHIGQHNSVEQALQSQCLRLPLQNDGNQGGACYSTTLREMLGSLLNPNPATRNSPTRLLEPLQNHHASPILRDVVAAAHPLCPGAPVTIDNVRLGMFVQRGQDWNEGELDGGWGSVGVVTRLDSDCAYTEVTFPLVTPFSSKPNPILCRIGAGNKLELRVGPTSVNDLFNGNTMANGLVPLNEQPTALLPPGYVTNNGKCKVVAVSKQYMFVVPTEKVRVPPLGLPESVSMFHQTTSQPDFVTPTPIRSSQGSIPLPKNWREQPEASSTSGVQLVDVTNGAERTKIVEQFFSITGGLEIQAYEICNIQRVQSISMWSEYVNCRESVVGENFGISDEKHLFHGTQAHDPIQLLSSGSVTLASFNQCASGFGSQTITFSSKAQFGDNRAHRASTGGIRRMVLSRVELGRAKDPFWSESDNSARDYHSIKMFGPTQYDSCQISNPFQAYPEYIITYRRMATLGPTRRIVRAANPSTPRNRPSNTASSRMPPRPRQTRSPAVTAPVPSIAQQTPASTPVASTPPRVPVASSSTPTSGAGVAANATPKTPETPSKVKECVICMERPVTHILIPCGHPCLCEVCATSQGLSRLRSKCPECRTHFRQAIRFYGKVVEDE